MAKFQSKVDQGVLNNMAKAMKRMKLTSSMHRGPSGDPCDRCGKVKERIMDVYINIEVAHGSQVDFLFCFSCWDKVSLLVRAEVDKIEDAAIEDAKKITYPPFLATKRMTPERLAQFVQHELEEPIERYKKELVEFTEKMMTNPAISLKWSDSEFKAAAQHEVLQLVLLTIKKHGIDAATRAIYDKVLSGARWPEHSTSLVSNQIDEYQTSAWAELLETLTYNPSEKEA